MTANSARPRSPSTPKEESNNNYLCYVECVLYTLLPSRHSFLVVQVTNGVAIPVQASCTCWQQLSISPSLNCPRIRRVCSCSFSWLTQFTTCDSSALDRGCKCQIYANKSYTYNNYYVQCTYHGIDEDKWHFERLKAFKCRNRHLLHCNTLVIDHEPFCGVFFLHSYLRSASSQFSFLTKFLFNRYTRHIKLCSLFEVAYALGDYII